jgi:hypothetical protein
MGPGTGEEAKVKLSNVNVLRLPESLAKTTLVISKLERLRKIFGGRPVPAPTSFAPPVDTDPNSVDPLKIDSVVGVFPVMKPPTEVTPPSGKVAVMVPFRKLKTTWDR